MHFEFKTFSLTGDKNVCAHYLSNICLPQGSTNWNKDVLFPPLVNVFYHNINNTFTIRFLMSRIQINSITKTQIFFGYFLFRNLGNNMFSNEWPWQIKKSFNLCAFYYGKSQNKCGSKIGTCLTGKKIIPAIKGVKNSFDPPPNNYCAKCP